MFPTMAVAQTAPVPHDVHPPRNHCGAEPHRSYSDSMTGPPSPNPQPDILGDGYEALTADLPDDAEGAGGRHPGPASGSAHHQHQGRAVPARLFRLLPPDRAGRVPRGPRRGLLRPRPAQVRPFAAAAPDPCPDVRCRRLLPGTGRGGRVHRRRGTRPPGGQRAFHRRTDRRALAARPADRDRRLGAGPRRGAEQPVPRRPGHLGDPHAGPATVRRARQEPPADGAAVRRTRVYYQLSTHRSERGEWDFVTGVEAGDRRRRPRRVAGRRATGHRPRARRARTWIARSWCCARTRRSGPSNGPTSCTAGDAVLDADALARWSTRLGTPRDLHPDRRRHARSAAVEAADVRERVFAEITRWTDAYAG